MDFKEEDYPCEYLNSNKTSLSSQKTYKLLIWLSLGLMLIATILSGISTEYYNISNDLVFSKIGGVILLLTAVFSTALIILKPENSWYIGRAVAESIKTLTWRYMMRSEPFESDNSNHIFIERCSDVTKAAIEKNQFTPGCNNIHNEFITAKMSYVRNLNFLERKSYYATARIDDQIKWYIFKSINNKRKASYYTSILIICQSIAGMYLVFFNTKLLGLDIISILIFTATSCISIIEMNKFKDLAQSYAFTAFELNTIRNRFSSIVGETELDEFVEHAEHAISREHTMWLARKGK